MPEIKHNFTGGKMNKDLDERLVQNGEYRDALNIQVSTSEDSEVGTIQNILGNVGACNFSATNPNPIPLGSKTVGSISDEKNDTLYWMVAGPSIDIQDANFCADVAAGLQTPYSFKDLIMKKQGHEGGGCRPVFVDKHTVILSNTVGANFGFVNNGNEKVLSIDNSIFLDEISVGMTVQGLNSGCVLAGSEDPPTITAIGNLTSFTSVFTPEIITSTNENIVSFNNTFIEAVPPEQGTGPVVPGSLFIPHSQIALYSDFPEVGDTIIVEASNGCGTIFEGQIGGLPNGGVPITLNANTPPNTLGMEVGLFLEIHPTNNDLNSPYYGNTFLCNGAPIAPGIATSINDPISTNGNFMFARVPWTGTGPDQGYVTKIGLAVTSTSATNVINLPPTSSFLDDIYELFFPGGNFDPSAGQIVFEPDALNYTSSIGLIQGPSDQCCILPNSSATQITSTFSIVDCADMATPCAPESTPSSNTTFTATFSTPPSTSPPLGASVISLDSPLDLTIGFEYLVFKRKRVLNYHKDKLITGINIVDDMLYWVDGVEHASLNLSKGGTEPKKINISRSVQGTNLNGKKHTQLVNKYLGPGIDGNGRQNIPVLEEHVAVIRKSPKEKPTITVNSGRNEFDTLTGVTQIGFDNLSPVRETLLLPVTGNDFPHNFSGISVGDTIRVIIETDINNNTEFELDWPIQSGNLEVVLKEFDDDGNPPIIPIESAYRIKGTVTDWDRNSLIGDSNAVGYAPFGPIDPAGNWANGVAMVQIKVTSVVGFPPLPTGTATKLKYAIDIFENNEKLFEFKFPRFSYRYKYEDGETSTFAPWSEIAFLPGAFDYHPNKGYNLGMTNRMTSVVIEGFTNNIPKDVVAVDILYKEEGNPNCFVIDTLKPNDPVTQSEGFNPWHSGNNGYYEIKRETIKSILPENQLLRAYDNVPRKALAQEVTGNRIVYGNYIQNFNLKSFDSIHEYVPDFRVSLSTYLLPEGGQPFHKKSIKSLREYQLGVIFTDEYGRETPVLSRRGASVNLPKENAATNNRLQLAFNNAETPEGMEYFKFYIKETSGQYYNVAMDRFYSAEDGNIWLAFPSTDVNKVDIDSFLILKKGIDSNELVTNPARYKVIAIENEAPDFVKTSVLTIGTFDHKPSDGKPIFGDDNFDASSSNISPQASPLEKAPVVGTSTFHTLYSPFNDTSANKLQSITPSDGTLYVEFEYNQTVTNRYKIVSVTADNDQVGLASKYFFKIDGTFGSDVNIICDDPDGLNATEIKENVKMRLFKYVVENKPQFDGRFFVKIYNDLVFEEYISNVFQTDINYRVVTEQKIFSLENETIMNTTHAFAVVSPQGVNKVTGNTSAYPLTGGFGNYQQGGPKEHIARSAYFGEHFWYRDASNPINGESGNYVDVRFKFPKRDLSEDFGNPPSPQYISGVETDVWFIDNGNHNLKRVGNDAVWYARPENMDNFNYPPFSSTGINAVGGGISYTTTADTKSRIDLALGGIAGEKMNEGCHRYHCGCPTCWDTSAGYSNTAYNPSSNWTADGLIADNASLSNINNFYQVGEDGGNESYDDEQTKSVVSSITSGSRFKWKEDPTQTIYTFTEQVTFQRLAQWSRQAEFSNKNEGASPFMFSSPANFHKTFRHFLEPAMNGWNPIGTYGQPINNGVKIGLKKQDISVNTTSGSSTISFVAAIPEDLIIGMKVTGVNGSSTVIPANTLIQNIDRQNNEIVITNDALSTNTPITLEFGFPIRVIAGSNLSLPNPTLRVDSKFGLCSNNNEKFDIAQNQMALVTHSNTGSVPNNYLLVKDVIQNGPNDYSIEFTGYTEVLTSADLSFTPTTGRRVSFEQVTMNSASPYTTINTDKSIVHEGASSTRSSIGAVGYTIQFVEESLTSGVGEGLTSNPLPDNPAIWETEPKETTDLNIYYEASDYYPIRLSKTNINYIIPINSSVYNENNVLLGRVINNSIDGETIQLSTSVLVEPGGFTDVNGVYTAPLEVNEKIYIEKPNNEIIGISIVEIVDDPSFVGITPAETRFFKLDKNLLNAEYFLNWHNCYSFGNGVESNRIRDNFNLPYILNGVKASTVLPDKYEEEHRKYGLIYSGVYNSNSGVNDLNQFIQAEKITKDVNPIYGSIQKLHSRDTDLVTLCEDKVLKILANKDAVFNADGNPQLTANQNVLGQTIPFIGEYGISKNPESFASEAYRAYFSDKVRGSIMRLSKDGLTPISEHGMKDWFRDNLRISHTIVGSYDDFKQDYNVTLLQEDVVETQQISANQTQQTTTNNTITVSFNENVRGWTSFKSFTPENAISCANKYYTFLKGKLWKHHHEGSKLNPHPRNKFYGQQYDSTFNVILNSDPGSIKSFTTLNYEGTQSRVIVPMTDPYTIGPGFAYSGITIAAQPVLDGNYYNLTKEDGWYVRSISTDQEKGEVPEFIEKEGKWFNWIRGKDANYNIQGYLTNDYGDFDEESMPIQGIGKALQIETSAVEGCTDPQAFNYDPYATLDNGSCISIVLGCTDPNANLNTYDPLANTDDGSCLYTGCLNDPSAINYGGPGSGVVPTVTNDDGSCITAVTGCTDPTAFNYDASANVDDGTCYPIVLGCTDGVTPAFNYITPTGNNSLDVNTEDGSCTYGGCTSPSATNYLNPGVDCDSAIPYPNPISNPLPPCPTFDDGSCIFPVFLGCTDSSACNYDNTATVDDGNCYSMACSVTGVDVTNYGAFAGDSTGNSITQLGSGIVNAGTPIVGAENTCGCQYCEPSIVTHVSDEYNPTNGTISFGFEIQAPGPSFNLSSFQSFRLQWRYQNGPFSAPIILTNQDITISHNGVYSVTVNNVVIIPNDPNQGSIDVRVRTFCNGTNSAGIVPRSETPQSGTAFINNAQPAYNAAASYVVQGCTCNGNQPNFAGVVNDCYGDGLPSINYNPLANTPTTGTDPSCIQNIPGCTCGGSQANGLVNGLGLYNDCFGNGYPADNFDPAATTDDGSCTQTSGCMDSTALNYDATVSVPDNASCVYTCEPITNLTVSHISPTGARISWTQSATQPWGNFNFPSAGIPTGVDGLPAYVDLRLKRFDEATQSFVNDLYSPATIAYLSQPTIFGAQGPVVAESPAARIFLDDSSRLFGNYTLGINSQLKPTAANVNTLTSDQGHITQVEIATAANDNMSWTLGGSDFNTPFGQGSTPTNSTVSDHMCPSCDPINANSGAVQPGQGAPGLLKPNTTYLVEYESHCTANASSGVVSTTFTTAHVEGCMTTTAVNYNPYATLDNGSCQIDGCTNPTAANYDPNANNDDGSCITGLIGCQTSPAVIPGTFNIQPPIDNITLVHGSANGPFNRGCAQSTESGSNSQCSSPVNIDPGDSTSICRYNSSLVFATNEERGPGNIQSPNIGYYSLIGQDPSIYSTASSTSSIQSISNQLGFSFGNGTTTPLGAIPNDTSARGYKTHRFQIAGYSVGGGNPFTNFMQQDLMATSINPSLSPGQSTHSNPANLSAVQWGSKSRLNDGTQPQYGNIQTPSNQFFDDDPSAGSRKYVNCKITDNGGNDLQPDTPFRIKITKKVQTPDGNGNKTRQTQNILATTLPCNDISVQKFVVGGSIFLNWTAPFNVGENKIGNTAGYGQFMRLRFNHVQNNVTTNTYIPITGGAQSYNTPAQPSGSVQYETGVVCFSGLPKVTGTGDAVASSPDIDNMDKWDHIDEGTNLGGVSQSGI